MVASMAVEIVQMPFQMYRRAPGVNATTLNAFARSPAYCRLRQLEPEKATASMRVGTAVHALILGEDGDANEELTAKEVAQAAEMAESLKTNPEFLRLFDAATHTESVIFWDHMSTVCKARTDLMSPDFICDIKTCRDLSRFSPWSITDYGYHRQAAWYKLGHERVFPEGLWTGFFFAVVQSSAPYETCVFRLDNDSLAAGMADAESLLAAYLECERTGLWTRHMPGLKVASASWAEIHPGG